MDISSTSSATATAAEVSTSSQSQKTSSKSNSSFKDEMKKVSESENKEAEKTEQETEQKTEAVDNKTDDKSNEQKDQEQNQNQTLKGEVNMVAGQNQQLAMLNGQNLQNNNIQTLLDANMQLSNITKMGSGLLEAKVDYSNINMSADDAKFFSDLVQNTDKTLQGVVNDLKSGVEQNVQKAAQHVKVSSTLMTALNDAVKSNQPVRINLDKDVSIILKVDKDGALSATFIPGDKAVEEYLRQNISTLRQRFDEQELSYRDLSYSRQKQNQEQNRRNNKENDNE